MQTNSAFTNHTPIADAERTNTIARVSKLQPISLTKLPDQPLVSVLIANYNYASYIGEAIESVLNQTYPNLEVIVADDGSTDDSCSIAESYAQQDARVKLIRRTQNGGMAAATNTAYAASRGEILCLLDSDDTYTPDKLERVVQHFISHPTVGLVVHPLMLVDAFNRGIRQVTVSTRFEHGWIAHRVIQRGGRWSSMAGGGTCFRRELADYIFPIPEATFRSKSDGFIATLAPVLTEVSAIDEHLYRYRLHGKNDFATLTWDADLAKSQAKGIALHVAGANARLSELGFQDRLFNINNNLNYLQQIHVLALFNETPRAQLLHDYVALARVLLADDLYGTAQKLVRLVIYGVAIPLPVSLRHWWLVKARSRTRMRYYVESGIGRVTGLFQRKLHTP